MGSKHEKKNLQTESHLKSEPDVVIISSYLLGKTIYLFLLGVYIYIDPTIRKRQNSYQVQKYVVANLLPRKIHSTMKVIQSYTPKAMLESIQEFNLGRFYFCFFLLPLFFFCFLLFFFPLHP